MNTKHFVLAMIILICTCLVSPLLAIGGNGKGGGGASPILTEKEAADLIFLREEEKLARDVYLALYDVWGTQIFLNISGSEQRHMDSVASLLVKYGVEDPVVNDAPGEFTNNMIAGLYETLVTQGSSSLRDALEVGVIIEEMDIHDIKYEMLPDATQRDVERVLTNLLAGSYNHLDAFEKSIAALP